MSVAESNRRRRKPLAERFGHWIDKSAGPDECWPWTGAANQYGYGIMNTKLDDEVPTAFTPASRLAWFFEHGYFPLKFVCHTCDNPPCVNPRHENARDMVQKKRHAFGARHPAAVLTEEEASAILIDGRPMRRIAEQHKVNKSTISRIKGGKRWGHLSRVTSISKAS